jgi:hypothetical protein
MNHESSVQKALATESFLIGRPSAFTLSHIYFPAHASGSKFGRNFSNLKKWGERIMIVPTVRAM